MYLFKDWETTGFKKSGPLVQDGQARGCQVAYLFTDENGNSLAEFAALIEPKGWTVGEGAQAVHGFTTEFCELYGVNIKAALGTYLSLAKRAKLVIAHNAEFDCNITEIECAYAGVHPPATPRYCTMLNAATPCGLPGNKWPKLEEALQILCGKTIDKAHDALYDVRACRDIFFELKNRGLVAA